MSLTESADAHSTTTEKKYKNPSVKRQRCKVSQNVTHNPSVKRQEARVAQNITHNPSVKRQEGIC